jgi:hypothetical protein
LKRKDLPILLLLTFAALLIHGYHPGAEDSEIYLTAVEHNLDPGLFPMGAEYFISQTRLSLYTPLIANSVRITHLPIAWALFLWHLLSILLLLVAMRRLSLLLFKDAQWAGVVLVAAVLTLPIAGTALYPMDEYLNPRNLSAFAQIFSIVAVLERNYLSACALLILTALLHPFMAAFAFIYCLLLVLLRNPRLNVGHTVLIAPLGSSLLPPTDAYHAIAASHYYHYILRWHWYELIGAIVPIASFWFFARWARAQRLAQLELVSRAALLFGIICTAAALIMSIPGSPESVARFQPMRGLFLIYLLFFVIGGSLLGKYVLKRKASRWALFFIPVCAAMYVSQRQLFPASAHVEWPWVKPTNQWVQAFQWVRDNTPKDAVFALDPYYLHIDGEDENGFRAIAQRSRLADAVKDSGVVAIFPPLAEQWRAQVQAQTGLSSFQLLPDFLRLKRDYGVTWLVLQQPGIPGLSCPYQNKAARVCRLP